MHRSAAGSAPIRKMPALPVLVSICAHWDLSIPTPPSYHSSLPNQDVLSLLIKQHWALQKNIHMQTHTHTYTHTHIHTYTLILPHIRTYHSQTLTHIRTYCALHIEFSAKSSTKKNESPLFNSSQRCSLHRRGHPLERNR